MNYLKLIAGIVFIFFCLIFPINAQIAINTNGSSPDASAMLDITSTDRGILIPRMISTDRENISNPSKGLMVFDLTTNSFWFYNTVWTEVDTDNQVIDVFSLSDNDLQLSLEADGQSTKTVDLSGFLDNTDDQTIDQFDLSGDNLRLSLENDGQSLQSVNLSSFKDNTDDQIIDVFSLSGNNLQLSLESDGQNTKTVSLSGFKQTLSLSNDNLSISNGNTIGLNSAFLRSNGLTYGKNINDDFLFGSNSLNYNSGTETKFFFDQDKGAFRAGAVTGTDWDDANVGDYSFAVGEDGIASGDYSISMGIANDATANYTTAIGSVNRANGGFSVCIGSSNDSGGNLSVAIGNGNDATVSKAIALGNDNQATAQRAVAIGSGNIAPSYGEIALGTYCTTYTPDNTTGFDDDDRIFVIGNGSSFNSRSDAFIMLKDGKSYYQGDAYGDGEYVLTIDNTNNNNNQPNNGLLIKAGHNSYNSNTKSSFIRFYRPDGTNCGRIRQDGGGSIHIVDSSDERLKENINPTKYGISDIMNIAVKDYNFITDDDSFVKTGFIAQQLYTVYPTIVTVGDDVKTNPWVWIMQK